MTPLEQHCEKWQGGCGSDLCQFATQRVLCRGTIPCDILFVGESPGTSEDILGSPFVGQAGRLLDQIVEQSVGDQYTCAYTNLVGCIPLDDTREKVLDGPPEEAIQQCQPRLQEFIHLCDPKVIVRVGKHAQDWVMSGIQGAIRPYHLCPQCKSRQWVIGDKLVRTIGDERTYLCKRGHIGRCGPLISLVDIKHPAFILRSQQTIRGLLVQRCVEAILEEVEKL